MKKIFEFFRENELESKWWHRLAKVLIYGSTIAVFVVCVILFFKHIGDWNNPDPRYIYSFESKYNETFGFPKACKFIPENSEDFLSIECGNISQKWSGGHYGFLPDFLDRYARSNSYKEEFLIRDTKCEANNRFSLDNFFAPFCYLLPNYDFLNKRIEQGHFDNIEAKRIVILGPLIRNISLVFLAPIFWFFLLKSIIYRAVIYIILGKKK
ncbi:MAG: hypothetical protein AAB438_00490 [Patescibacteria group bacterium]